MARHIHALIGRGTGPVIHVEQGATKLIACVTGLPTGQFAEARVLISPQEDAVYPLTEDGETSMIVGSKVQFSYEGTGQPVFMVRVA